ncbi:RidA family protein [Govanella unica]|uniref:RidA family protein n=1 Tax=Govanella unica TaxID=2975056 RepID=A0A9X3U258_9PROT|nr:RidA family protein [Govania unica]MDA5195039.1 RidA family protein [Govania unica]
MAHLDQVQYFFEPIEKQLGFVASAQAGPFIYISGVISIDETMTVIAPGDMGGQITRIYDIMELILARHQAKLEHVINEIIFVTDLGAMAAAAEARSLRYAKAAPPATTAVQVAGLFLADAMIEIHATAYVA